MEMDWRNRWGNFIVAHRSPENWRKYGEEAGRLLAENEWDGFVFYRDAGAIDDLALAVMPKAIDKKTERMTDELMDLRPHGVEAWRLYHEQPPQTPAERKMFSSAFRQAYTKVVNAYVDDLIPPKLRKNLDLFCNLLSIMRNSMGYGSGRAAEYGLQLSGRRKVEAPKEPPKPTYKPTRKEVRDYINEGAQSYADSVWKKYMARKSDGHDFRTNMFSFSFNFPGDWDMSEEDQTDGVYLYGQAFMKAIGEKALELAPASAWKNSYLICSLYDLMLAQDPPKKEFVPSGESRPKKGFWAKEQHESLAKQMERQAWEHKTRDEIRKSLEREMKRGAKSGEAKMSGLGSPAGSEALIIVHLSSLDAYTAHAGMDEGALLGERLTKAILEHEGPVIIVDQGWETGYRESRPRERLLEAVSQRPDLVWIQFDEAVEDWEDFFPKLYAALDEQGATSAIVGGIWYDDSLHTGCATFTYLTLRQRMPVTVDESLVGCE